MKASVWSQYLYEETPEEKIDTFLKYGFEATEFSDEDGFVLMERANPYEEAKKLRLLAEAKGFSYPQGHLFLKTVLTDADATEVLKKWLTLFNELGIISSVLHIQGGMEIEESKRHETQVKVLSELAQYIKGSGMTICLENLFGGRSSVNQSAPLLQFIEEAGGGEELGICLDTGHLNVARFKEGVTETQREFILHAGKRLKALHLADNNGTSDQHLLPFARGTVNFREVVTALHEVGYDRLFNFEIPGESCNCPRTPRMYKLAYARAVADELLK